MCPLVVMKRLLTDNNVIYAAPNFITLTTKLLAKLSER